MRLDPGWAYLSAQRATGVDAGGGLVVVGGHNALLASLRQTTGDTGLLDGGSTALDVALLDTAGPEGIRTVGQIAALLRVQELAALLDLGVDVTVGGDGAGQDGKRSNSLETHVEGWMAMQLWNVTPQR